MQNVYGFQCIDVSTVQHWVKHFKDGEMGQAELSDKPRSGRSMIASDQVHQDHIKMN